MEAIRERLTKLEDTMSVLVEMVKDNSNLIKSLVSIVDERFTAIEGRLTVIEGRLGAMDERLGAMDERLGTMDERFDTIEVSLNTFKRETALNFSNVDRKLDNIAFELHKIGIATRYEADYQSLIKLDPEIAKRI